MSKGGKIQFQDKKAKIILKESDIHQPLQDVYNGKLKSGGLGKFYLNWCGEFKSVSELLPKNMHGLSFIDVGCSAGAYCILAKKRNAKRVVGVDISSHFLELGRSFANKHNFAINFLLQDITKGLRFKNKEFDIAICLQTIEHSRHPFRILEEVLRISKESIISTPNYLFPTYIFKEPRKFGCDSHKFIFTHKLLRQLLENELNVKVIYQNFVFSNIIVMKTKNA